MHGLGKQNCKASFGLVHPRLAPSLQGIPDRAWCRTADRCLRRCRVRHQRHGLRPAAHCASRAKHAAYGWSAYLAQHPDRHASRSHSRTWSSTSVAPLISRWWVKRPGLGSTTSFQRRDRSLRC